MISPDAGQNGLTILSNRKDISLSNLVSMIVQCETEMNALRDIIARRDTTVSSVYRHRRRASKAMIIIGGVLLVLGAAGLWAALFTEMAHPASKGELSGHIAIGGGSAAVVGILLLIGGSVMKCASSELSVADIMSASEVRHYNTMNGVLVRVYDAIKSEYANSNAVTLELNASTEGYLTFQGRLDIARSSLSSIKRVIDTVCGRQQWFFRPVSQGAQQSSESSVNEVVEPATSPSPA